MEREGREGRRVWGCMDVLLQVPGCVSELPGAGQRRSSHDASMRAGTEHELCRASASNRGAKWLHNMMPHAEDE